MTNQPDSGFSGEARPSGPDRQDPPRYPGVDAGPESAPPPPPHPEDDLNNLAVASAALGFLGGCAGISAILGIIALVQIRGNGGRGRGPAIFGIVAMPFWLVIATIWGLAVHHGDSTNGAATDSPKPEVTQSAAQALEVRDLRAGQCVNGAIGGGEADAVTVVPCTRPHDGEVVFTGTLKGLTRPTDARIEKRAEATCKRHGIAKIKRDPAAERLAIAMYYPPAEGWRSGDHGVACLAANAVHGKKLTRPLKTG